MNKNSKIAIMSISFCLIISFVFISIYKINNEELIYIGDIKDYNSGDAIYNYYIDEVIYDSKQCVINGWAAKVGQNLEYVNRKLVLVDETGKLYAMNTVKVYRTSVTEYFHDGYFYSHSGLQGAFNLKDIKNSEGYTLGILIFEQDGQAFIINTNNSIKSGGQNEPIS